MRNFLANFLCSYGLMERFRCAKTKLLYTSSRPRDKINFPPVDLPAVWFLQAILVSSCLKIRMVFAYTFRVFITSVWLEDESQIWWTKKRNIKTTVNFDRNSFFWWRKNVWNFGICDDLRVVCFINLVKFRQIQQQKKVFFHILCRIRDMFQNG